MLFFLFFEALIVLAIFAVWIAWGQAAGGEHKSTEKTQYISHGEKHRAQHAA